MRNEEGKELLPGRAEYLDWAVEQWGRDRALLGRISCRRLGCRNRGVDQRASAADVFEPSEALLAAGSEVGGIRVLESSDCEATDKIRGHKC